MFRAQQNAFDDAVGMVYSLLVEMSPANCPAAKATDENLTSENWELILVGTRS